MAALCREARSRNVRMANLIKKKESSSINPFIFFPPENVWNIGADREVCACVFY
jgi:hypothetical protein